MMMHDGAGGPRDTGWYPLILHSTPVVVLFNPDRCSNKQFSNTRELLIEKVLR